MPTKKSKKLNSLSQANAKVETQELTSLDQIWGFNEISRYGTIDETEYKKDLYYVEAYPELYTKKDEVQIKDSDGVNQLSYVLKEGDPRIKKVTT